MEIVIKMNEIKGIFFNDLEKVRRYGIWDIRLFCISLISLVILMVLAMAQIFSNEYVSVVCVLFTIFTLLGYFLLKVEYILIQSGHRRKKILEVYKCTRQGCRNCTGSCIDVGDYGVSICIYLDHEFKENINKLIEVSKVDK